MAKDIFITGTGGVAMLLHSIESLTESLLEILEDKEKFVRSKNTLKDYASEKGKNLLLYSPAEFSFKDVCEKLEKEKVPFVIGFKGANKDNEKENDENKKRKNAVFGKPYIVIRDCDKEKIKQIQTNLYIEKRRISEITNSEFYNYFQSEQGKILSYSNLSHYQVNCFGKIAQAENFIFTRKQEDDGKYTIYIYDEGEMEDVERVNRALVSLACKSAGTIAIMEEAKSDVDKDTVRDAIERGINSRTHFYVANCSTKFGRNEYVEVSDSGFSVFKNDEMTQNYNKMEDSNYEAHLAIALLSLENPVILDDEHFKVSPEKREDNLDKSANERNIKISNSIKKSLKEKNAITTKEIRDVENELKDRIMAWIEDPETNKINSTEEMLNDISEDYRVQAKNFIDEFNNIYNLIMDSQEKQDLEEINVLIEAASKDGDFMPSFDSGKQEERII